MAKRLLICSIARNARGSLDRWLSQLIRLEALIRDEWSVTVACAENDSVDGTAEWLRNTAANREALGIPFPIHVSTETLGTRQYDLVWDVTRIRRLAAARNKCLEIAGPLVQFDKIAYVEVDVSWEPSWCKELVLARHPAQAGIVPHVYSGWSLRALSHPKEAQFLYDTCATRATSRDVCWDVNENAGKWRGESLIRTDLGGVDSNCLHRVWSTFNCLCVYDAKPFVEGVKWEAVNRYNRWLNPSNIWVDDGDIGSGYTDADTAVMCEAFRDRGYHNVLLNTNCLIRHD